jgi:CRP-like cAMP-binding protein
MALGLTREESDMPESKEHLRGVPIFEELDDEELDLVVALGVEREHAEGDILFHEGESTTSMFLVLEGAVEIQTKISEGLQKTIATARAGKVFGVVSLVDEGERPTTARVAEPTRTLGFERAQFVELGERHPLTVQKIVLNLAVDLAESMRLVAEEYRQTIRWGLEVSGAMQINLHRLVSDRATVEVELLSGKSITGVILAVERSASGLDLILRSEEGKLCDVPYHAIAMATFDVNVLRPTSDAISGLREE